MDQRLFSPSSFSSFFFPVHECLCSCRTWFYKTENTFPGWCKLWLNNVASSPVIIPMPPSQAQINGLFWSTWIWMNHDVILGTWQPWCVGDGISASVALWQAPRGEGFALIEARPAGKSGELCRHGSSCPGLGLDDNVFFLVSFYNLTCRGNKVYRIQLVGEWAA